MTLRHPGTVPDRAAAHAYPAAKVALATGGEPETAAAAALSSTERTGEVPRADPAGDKTIRASQAAGKTIAINADGAPWPTWPRGRRGQAGSRRRRPAGRRTAG